MCDYTIGNEVVFTNCSTSSRKFSQFQSSTQQLEFNKITAAGNSLFSAGFVNKFGKETAYAAYMTKTQTDVRFQVLMNSNGSTHYQHAKGFLMLESNSFSFYTEYYKNLGISIQGTDFAKKGFGSIQFEYTPHK